MAKREIVEINTPVLFNQIATVGWSRSTFAVKMMGKSRTWCSEWIKTPPKNLPSPEEAARMCAILGIEPEAFVIGEADIQKVRGLIDAERDARDKAKPATIYDDELLEEKRKLLEKVKLLDKQGLAIVDAAVDAILAQRPE